jgi:chromosome segregation ATPase
MRSEKTRRRRNLVGGLLLAGAIVALAGAAVYFALDDHANRDSARRWRARATELRHVLDARDTQLAQRTHALTAAGGQLASLGGQVGTLDQRTRELAAEKAQVEDQRAALQARSDALTKVARSEIACSNDLSQAIPHISAQDSAWLSANASTINGDCQQAQNALNAFNATYG